MRRRDQLTKSLPNPAISSTPMYVADEVNRKHWLTLPQCCQTSSCRTPWPGHPYHWLFDPSLMEHYKKLMDYIFRNRTHRDICVSIICIMY